MQIQNIKESKSAEKTLESQKAERQASQQRGPIAGVGTWPSRPQGSQMAGAAKHSPPDPRGRAHAGPMTLQRVCSPHRVGQMKEQHECLRNRKLF